MLVQYDTLSAPGTVGQGIEGGSPTEMEGSHEWSLKAAAAPVQWMGVTMLNRVAQPVSSALPIV